MVEKKITFIGAGNMAYACAKGFVENNIIKLLSNNIILEFNSEWNKFFNGSFFNTSLDIIYISSNVLKTSPSTDLNIFSEIILIEFKITSLIVQNLLYCNL